MENGEGEFKFKIGQEILTHDWPSKVEIRGKIVDRRKTMFAGKAINEYKIEILEKEKKGRQILLFEKDLWVPSSVRAKKKKKWLFGRDKP